MDSELKRFVKLILSISILFVSVESKNIKSIGEAIDIAGQQRMFTQKMLKDYGMIGIGVSFGNPEEDLKKTIEDFDAHLNELMAFAKGTKIEQSLKEEEKSWQSIKKMLLSKPSKENAIKLKDSLDKLLKLSNDITNMFTKQAGDTKGSIINIAGRQRMLSQKMASLYMLKVWGIDNEGINKELDDTIKIFEESLDKLKKSKLNDDKIKTLLKHVEADFSFFKIMNRSSSKFIPSLIYKKSNEILIHMDKITKLYENK